MKKIPESVLPPFFLSTCEKEEAGNSAYGGLISQHITGLDHVGDNRIVAFEPAAETGGVYTAVPAEGGDHAKRSEGNGARRRCGLV